MPERQDLEDRLSRARSWILSARDFGRKGDHRHIEFLMLYVAFNSLYGRRQFEGSKAQARADLNQFLKKVRAMRRLDETAGGITLSKAIRRCPGPC